MAVSNLVFQRRFLIFAWLLAHLGFFPVQSAPRITEFLADNETGLKDEDGEASDWIEIHNPDNAVFSLAGCYLTDDPTNLRKWKFPPVNLNPGAFLVVFASGKNRIDPARKLHASFALSADGEYLALIAPNGLTVLSHFSPGFPPQFDNISYGFGGTADAPAISFFSPPTPGASNAAGTRAGPIIELLVQNPPRPAPGPMRITAELRAVNSPVASVNLFYRRMFNTETNLAMNDSGVAGDLTADDGIWSATIPAGAFVAGEMTRWRVTASDTAGTLTKEPAYRVSTDSHQYYGTVAQDPELQSLLPVVHWFTSNPGGAGTSSGSRGAVYWDGEFYDNVLFNIHGQSTAGFPKKSYNLDFNRTQRFRWSTNAPRVADIDLITNWADKAKVRQVLGYEVMRAAGVPAHFAFTVRVEQNGNFFSTADFVEDADETYLERAGLNPQGALYKVYANVLNKDNGDSGSSGVEKKTRKFENNSDLQALINGLDLTGASLNNYIRDNVNIARCVNMLAANSVIRNIDMHSKNWYAYRDTGRSGEWAILPWDLDLSHGRVWNTQNTYFDNALYNDGFVVSGTSIRLVSQLFQDPLTRAMIMRRVRTLTDRFLQQRTPATPESELFYERRLNEQAALIDPPSIIPSDARRDFEKWGSWLQGGATVSFSNTNPAVETMAEAIHRFKTEYLPARRNHIYNTQIIGRGGEIPLAQAARPLIHFGSIDVSPVSGNQDEEFIQLSNTNAAAVDISGWRLAGGVEHTFLDGTVIPARNSLYVTPNAVAFRARTTAPRGGQGLFIQGGYQGHLSNLGEVVALIDEKGATNSTIAYQGQPSDPQRYLVVSEIMYRPPGDGLAEFIELLNISQATTLNLAGVRFTAGVEFDFTGSSIKSLPPGGRALVVRDLAAFAQAYGSGLPIAGVFTNDTALSNGGEKIKLEDTDNQTIREFVFDDALPWPADADGLGFSVVLINPESNPNHAFASNWRASVSPGGSPGISDSVPFPSDPAGDANNNGQPDLIDYALGNDLANPPLYPEVSWSDEEPPGIRFTYPRSIGADRVQIEVLYSLDLAAWAPAGEILDPGVAQRIDGGRMLMVWRVKSEVNASAYLRLRISPK